MNVVSEAVRHLGGASQTASKLNDLTTFMSCSRDSVNGWVRRGAVPPEWAVLLAQITPYTVTELSNSAVTTVEFVTSSDTQR